LSSRPPSPTFFPYTTLFRSYSSIAQAGYALVGVVAATTQGVAAVMFFLLAYAFTQLGAFLAVGSDVEFAPDDTIEGYSGLHFRRSEEHTSELQSLTKLLCPL